MPRALIFSDIHGDSRALNKLLDIEADYYFAAGDLANFGRGLEEMGEILRRREGKMYVMPGNHESSRDIALLCARFGFVNFHEKTMQIGETHVAGLGYSNLTPFDTPGEYTEEEIAARLTKFEGLHPLVLICHCPPYHTALDRIKEGNHAGSHSVRDFIEKQQPEYFFCGHIHEAAGAVTQIGVTEGRNVGKKGYLLHLE
jgi:Icc-related predicted phosphoesterase